MKLILNTKYIDVYEFYVNNGYKKETLEPLYTRVVSEVKKYDFLGSLFYKEEDEDLEYLLENKDDKFELVNGEYNMYRALSGYYGSRGYRYIEVGELYRITENNIYEYSGTPKEEDEGYEDGVIYTTKEVENDVLIEDGKEDIGKYEDLYTPKRIILNTYKE